MFASRAAQAARLGPQAAQAGGKGGVIPCLVSRLSGRCVQMTLAREGRRFADLRIRQLPPWWNWESGPEAGAALEELRGDAMDGKRPIRARPKLAWGGCRLGNARRALQNCR